MHPEALVLVWQKTRFRWGRWAKPDMLLTRTPEFVSAGMSPSDRMILETGWYVPEVFGTHLNRQRGPVMCRVLRGCFGRVF